MPTKAPLVVPAPITGKFRPATSDDFKSYAKNLAALTLLGLQKAQELLARIYGYANLHELHMVLSEPGIPGPFENEEEPMRFLPGWVTDTYGDQLRRVLTLTDAAVRAGSPETPLYRVKLASLLGLFASPDMHRRCVAMVQSHLRLIEKLGLAPTLVEPLSGYRYPWTFDERALDEFRLVKKAREDDEANEEGASSRRFVPQEQLDTLFQFHLARQVLAGTPAGPRHPLTREFVLEETDEMDQTLRILDARYKDMVVGNAAYDMMYAVFPEARGPDDYDAMEQKLGFRDLCTFIETQNPQVMGTHPVLQRFDNPGGYASDLLNEFRTQEARRYLRNPDNVQAVLYTLRELPGHSGFDIEKGHLELYVHLKRTAASASDNNMVLWDVFATGSLVDTEKRTSTPVALMRGTLIVPFRGEEKPAEVADGHDFETTLLEHSNELSHAAEALRDYYLGRQSDEAGAGRAILYTAVELASGASAEMKPHFLRMLLSALNNAAFTHWRAPFPTEAEKDIGSSAVFGDLCLGATTALLLHDSDMTVPEALLVEKQTGVEVLFYSAMLYGLPKLQGHAQESD
jgi:hypothetical protein